MLRQIVSLFLLKTGLVSAHIKNLLEEYIESSRVIISEWKDYSWKVWYKEIPYFDKDMARFQKFTDGNFWKVIQYHMDKNAKYILNNGEYKILFNRTGKIRAVNDISAGNNFIIMYKRGWGVPCICILRNKTGERNNFETYNCMLKYASNSDHRNLIKLVNMYCHVYPMFSMAPLSNAKNQRVYTFGIQEYTEGVINDGLYVKESEVKGDDKGDFIFL